jgi:hypothetical protein
VKSPLNAMLLHTKTLYYAQQRFMRSSLVQLIPAAFFTRFSCA